MLPSAALLPTATRFGVPAASRYQDVRCPLCLARPACALRQRPRVQRPPRPASGACPASARPVSVLGLQSPVSDVRCPVSGATSGIRACRIRVRSVRTGEFVEREGAAGSHTPRDRPGRRLTPSAEQPVRGGSPTAAGCVQVGRSVLPACSRPRRESLSRGPSALGGLWPTARACAAPPRPKAAGGPSTAVRPGGETRSDLGEPWWAYRDLNLGPSLSGDNQALILTSQTSRTRYYLGLQNPVVTAVDRWFPMVRGPDAAQAPPPASAQLSHTDLPPPSPSHTKANISRWTVQAVM
jgi:hypothetical protein